jgi:hypothetical protein
VVQAGLDHIAGRDPGDGAGRTAHDLPRRELRARGEHGVHIGQPHGGPLAGPPRGGVRRILQRRLDRGQLRSQVVNDVRRPGDHLGQRVQRDGVALPGGGEGRGDRPAPALAAGQLGRLLVQRRGEAGDLGEAAIEDGGKVVQAADVGAGPVRGR